MACLSNKEINEYIHYKKHSDRIDHIESCKRCNVRYTLIKKTLDRMAEYTCSLKNDNNN